MLQGFMPYARRGLLGRHRHTERPFPRDMVTVEVEAFYIVEPLNAVPERHRSGDGELVAIDDSGRFDFNLR
jgi:hypothetical protein